MSEDLMLYCLIAFILGWLVSRHMGNGFRVGCEYSWDDQHYTDDDDFESRRVDGGTGMQFAAAQVAGRWGKTSKGPFG